MLVRGGKLLGHTFTPKLASIPASNFTHYGQCFPTTVVQHIGVL